MRKSERINRAVLIFLVITALLAIGLQIVNEKTNLLETIYEIATFSVALSAVILAVVQGMMNARTTRDLEKVISEMHELMKNVERNERR
ncbi:hypothetical protein FWC31_01945 [Candidatus Saccharibacteria bacterium]|nr:hypothetical protein [Candidatus Saccharibacteria bacterium]